MKAGWGSLTGGGKGGGGGGGWRRGKEISASAKCKNSSVSRGPVSPFV